MEETPYGDRGDAGFVLLSVLLAAALFTAVAVGLAVRARLLALQTANRIEAVRAEALADGAALFVADALRPPPTRPPDAATLVAAALAGQTAATPSPTPADPPPLPTDGTPLACSLPGNGGAMEIAAVDQAALLDLNGASVPMLRDGLAAAGLEGEAARRLADEIGDYRDPDDDPQNNGVGERAQYAARGLGWGPANAPFADVDEIARLPDATPALVARVKPLFTVNNPQPGIDLRLAPRATGGLVPPDAASVPTLARWNLASARTDYVVEARLRRTDGSIAAARRAVITFRGRRADGPRLLRWVRPVIDPEAAAVAAAEKSGAPLFCAALALALGDALRK